jgi:hypothetical protein
MMRLTTMKVAGLTRPALIAGVLALASLLAGCHGVVSSKPWFARADASAPRLRDGVWRGVSSLTADCAVDEHQPIAAWPNCARPLIVRGGELVSPPDDKGHRTSTRFVLADGQPLILQLRDQGSPPSFEYEWIRVTGLDDQGRVVALAGWRILCGSTSASGPTLFPGLTQKDEDCTAASLDALHAAAKASQADITDPIQAHWVRDGER